MKSGVQDQLCRILRTHFNSLRQRQKQNRDLTTITEDVKFAIKFVGDSVPRPVPVLRSMGMILLRNHIAFNLNMLVTQLAITRKNGILATFHRDGWKNANDEIIQQIIPLVGENDLKNWCVLEYPVESEISRELMANTSLLATETSISEDIKAADTDDHGDVSFPLVSIRYERVFSECSVVDFAPLERAVKMEIVKTENLSLRIPEAS